MRVSECCVGLVCCRGEGSDLHVGPLGARLCVSLRRLHALQHRHNALHKPDTRRPLQLAPVHLLLDRIHVHHRVDLRSLLGPRREVCDPIADLRQHAHHAHVARRLQLQVVHQRVPEGDVEALSDPREDGVLHRAAALVVELE
eukprot:675217-Rhodomonas_salina.2